MNSISSEPRTTTPLVRVGWIVVYSLAALNIIALGFLLFTLIWSWFAGHNTVELLLNGLRDQHKRLEIMELAPCDSPEMQRYQRGEIGPVIGSGRVPETAAPQENPDVAPTVAPRPELPENETSPSENPPTEQAPASPPATTQPLGGLDLLSPAELRDLIDHSVVRVLAIQGPDRIMTGTGFAISADTVVTNLHVVEGTNDGQFFIASKYLGGEPVRAKILARTANFEFGNPDFAVLRLENGKALKPLNVGDEPQPLESVVAAGYPGITIMSDRNDTVPDVVYSQGDVSVVQPQPNGVSLVIHTANIAPGSSGGPLINRCGTLVGVNTFVTSGEQSEGRALYALSGKSLAEFLRNSNITYRAPSDGDCSGGTN